PPAGSGVAAAVCLDRRIRALPVRVRRRCCLPRPRRHPYRPVPVHRPQRQPHRRLVAHPGDRRPDARHQPPAGEPESAMSLIAVVGLATMGMNLARNLARNGFGVSVYNRTTSRVDDFMRQYGSEGAFTPAHTPQELVSQLEKPRRILIMVKAGPPVDETIEHLAPYLEAGDILIDGGNSYFLDTVRRGTALEA